MTAATDAPREDDAPARRRTLLLLLAPALLILTARLLPLMLGSQTLFLRDVHQFHLPAKMAQAEGLRQGELWLLDPYRGGGQPLLGNPNAAPFYPDTALLTFLDPIWVVNAHFWVHLLIAPFTMFWLARRLGLRSEAAAAAGVFYATGGIVLSHLNFYNLIAGATWIPAFAACALSLVQREPPSGTGSGGETSRRWLPVALGVLWALMILGGDPILALLGLLLAATLLLVLAPRRLPPRLPVLALATLGGTLLAAPQMFELWRIVGSSFRSLQGYSEAVIFVTSVHPMTLIEALIPFAFGKPDLDFWGGKAFGDAGNAFFWSLSPGAIAWLFILSSGLRPRRERLACWVVLATSLFLATGGHNPLMRLLVQLPGASLARYPAKALVLAAVALALLAGLGVERWLRAGHGARRRGTEARGSRFPAPRALAPGLLLLGTLAATVTLLTSLPAGPLAGGISALLPPGREPLLPDILQYWRQMALALVMIAAGGATLLHLQRRRAPAALAVTLTVQTVAQVLLLAPLLVSDDAAIYRSPSPALASIRQGERAVIAATELFGSQQPRAFDDSAPQWLARHAWNDLYPLAGVPAGVHYDFTFSPDGLDSYLARMTLDGARTLPPEQKIEVLRKLGVGVFFTDRNLRAELPPKEGAALSPREPVPSFGQALHAWQIPDAAPRAYLAHEVHRAESLGHALSLLASPELPAGAAAVLPGTGAPRRTAPGHAEVVEWKATRIRIEADSPEGGVLVVQRSTQPVFRATVDGEPAPLLVANMSRVGVEVPAGAHTIEIEASPAWGRSLTAVLLGLAVLAVLSRRRRAVS